MSASAGTAAASSSISHPDQQWQLQQYAVFDVCGDANSITPEMVGEALDE
jgi:hypothetical protein